MPHNPVETPGTSEASAGLYKSLLKRLRFSPDEDSVQMLKNFCMEEKATTD